MIARKRRTGACCSWSIRPSPPARYYTYDPATNTFPGPYDRQLSGLLNEGRSPSTATAR